jgi:soluble P-type ATPase
MQYTIPYAGTIEINTIVLDLNGTLSVHGRMVEGARERLEKLKKLGFAIVLFSGDQRGNAAVLCDELDIEFRKTETGADKEKYFQELDTAHTAAIGNARIDIGTFKHAKLSIATLQGEGIHAGILEHVDIIVKTINDAFDLFIDSSALIATLRE